MTSKNGALTRLRQQDQTIYWCDDALENAQFIHAFHTDFLFPPHMHESYSIGVIEGGGHRFMPRRRSPVIMPSGTICVINPGDVHEGRAATDEGYRYRMFCPPVSLVEKLVESVAPSTSSGFWSFSGNVIDDPELYREFRALHIASSRGESLLERETRAILFIRRLLQRHAGLANDDEYAGRESRTVSRTIQYLHDNFDQSISISDLADEAGVSETHVIRSFSQAVGMPPHSYLISLRVERAKVLLIDGRSLADTAISVGFYDQSKLAHHFKRLTGTSPGRYSAQVRDVVVPAMS